jgi:hypothetical protein
MQLENQVVSLELAQRLKDLGVKQESYFFWYGGKVLRKNQLTQELRRFAPPVSAFTVAELGEGMNAELTDANESDSFTLKISNAIDFWCVSFGNDDHDITPQFESTKLADALAEMLIYLRENNLLEL